MSTKLAFGLLHQPKWIPLRYAPLSIELELVNAFTDVCIGAKEDNITDRWPLATTSTSWRIEQVEVKCDVCTLDNALGNSYEAHLLQSNSLPINYNTYINQQQAIAGTDISVNVSRAISRLKSIFINFSEKSSPDVDSVTREAALAANPNYEGGLLGNFGDINKPFNGFYNPMSGQVGPDEDYDAGKELSLIHI